MRNISDFINRLNDILFSLYLPIVKLSNSDFDQKFTRFFKDPNMVGKGGYVNDII